MTVSKEISNNLMSQLPRSGVTGSKSSTSIESQSEDHSLINDIGHSFVISNRLLGHGSYGDVFLANDEKGKEVAVKCCPINSDGIPNIMEASIMASVIHPFLNRALRIQASDTKLYIIQEKAETDLAQYTRRDKGNYKPNIEELKKWSYCLAQAVAALHKENIIHADIKASNVLLYEDGSVRLTDYTLSTKKWIPGKKFNHNVCTCTHRPLECLTKRSWDESLDIWSLGCTFYEIAYGELLFPYQGILEPVQGGKIIQERQAKSEAKIRLRNRSINAIIDWASRGPNSSNSVTSQEVIGTTQFALDYIPFILCEDFKRPEMALFNSLLCSMLNVDPSKRPTIYEVISHPFFEGLSSPVYLSLRRPLNNITGHEHARVTTYIQRYSDNTIVQQHALDMYRRCNELYDINEHIRAAVCTWIASKIILGTPPEIALPKNQILAGERDVCHNLGFRLHC